MKKSKLQIFALYELDKYPDWIFFVVDYSDEIAQGLIFDKSDMTFHSGFYMKNNENWKRVGYALFPGGDYHITLTHN